MISISWLMYFSRQVFFLREALLMALAARSRPFASQIMNTSPKEPAPITLIGLYLCSLSSFSTSSNFIFSLIMCVYKIIKLQMAEPFRKDRNKWSPAELEQVQYFYRCNEFFSPIFESRYLNQILDMSFYCKIINEPLYLKDDKRPIAVILLSGQIAVYKRQVDLKQVVKNNRQDKKDRQFIKQKELHKLNETLNVSSQCKLVALHGLPAECLFVPSFLYNKYIYRRKQEKDDIMFNMLNTIFKVTERKPIMELAQAGCVIRELRFNDYVYHQGDQPEGVFIILEGSAKVEQPGFSYKTNSVVVVSVNSILGDKDLLLPQRESSVLCCSSHLRLLQIPKEPFLKFARGNLPDFKEPKLSPYKSSQKQFTHIKRRSLGEAELKLPSIFRVYSAVKSKEEEEREYNLIKNSHILLDVCSPRKDKIRVRSSLSDKPLDIMKEKTRFFKKVRGNQGRVDLTHRII